MVHGPATPTVTATAALAADMDIGTGFVGSVELMGRVGPAFGGRWTLIESLPLGPGPSKTR